MIKISSNIKTFPLILTVIIVLSFSSLSHADDWYNQSPIEETFTFGVNATEESSKIIMNAIDEKVDNSEEDSMFKDKNDVFFNASTESQRLYASYADTLPTVTIDDWINWVNRKGYEVIAFFQVIVQPFTMLIFIISAFLTLVGTIGRGDLAGKGMWGMIMSAIIYAAVLYAPLILNSFVGWVAT